MKKTGLLFLSLMIAASQAIAQRAAELEYEPSDRHPFGRQNPDAPAELAQFKFMIGKNDCRDERLNNATGDWDSGARTWDAYYFMNGHAIKDTGRSGATTNGNIRLYDTVTGQWQVTFFSMPVYSSGSWSGSMEETNLVLRQAQKAPGTDLDGFSTLTFHNISDNGFDWTGEWVSADERIVFPFWRISCTKLEAP